jgi:hypothetical protein
MPRNKKTRSKAQRGGLGLSPSVSLVTVTHSNRHELLSLVAETIRAQDYPHIIEWVIVNGTPSDGDLRDTLAEEDLNNGNIPIRMCSPSSEEESSSTTKNFWNNLRYVANQRANGNVVVVMDDDTYYPSSRVSHAVKQLQKHPKKLVAGCAPVLMYDFETSRLYQYTHVGDSYSIDACLAYRQECSDRLFPLDATSDTTVHHSFRQPMIQLSPAKTCLHFSHPCNTTDFKRHDIETCLRHDGVGPTLCVRPHESIYDLMYVDPCLVDRYLQCFAHWTSGESDYDITIYCGAYTPTFDVASASLDGGEDCAVVELAKRLALQKFRVQVYCQLESKTTGTKHDYIMWRHYTSFPLRTRYATLVMWGYDGIVPWLTVSALPSSSSDESAKHEKLPLVSAEQLYVYLTDNHPSMFQLLHSVVPYVKGFFVKSRAHWNTSVQLQRRIPLHKTIIVPDGIRDDQFRLPSEEKRPVREWCRLCYVAEQPYGLKPFLEHAWPVIQQAFPHAVFHVYHGLDQLDNNVPNVKAVHRALQDANGIVDHGRQPPHVLAMEKWRSNLDIHVVMDNRAMPDCVAVRESAQAGCLPVLSDVGVFDDLDGYHIPIPSSSSTDNNAEKTYFRTVGDEVVRLLRDPDMCERFRQQVKPSKTTCVNWDRASVTWAKVFRDQHSMDRSLQQVRPCLRDELNRQLQETFRHVVYIPTETNVSSVEETVGIDASIVTTTYTHQEQEQNQTSSALVYEALQWILDYDSDDDDDDEGTTTEKWYWFMTSDAACDMWTWQRVWPSFRDALQTCSAESLGLVFVGGGSHLKQFHWQPLYHSMLQQRSSFVYTHQTSLPGIAQVLCRRHLACFMVTRSMCRRLVKDADSKTPLEEQIHTWDMDDKLPVTEVLPHPFYLRNVT